MAESEERNIEQKLQAKVLINMNDPYPYIDLQNAREEAEHREQRPVQ